MQTPAPKWSKKIPSLADHTLRTHFASTELYAHPPEALAAGLNEVCIQIDDRVHAARQVLTAFLPALIAIKHLERVSEIRNAAQQAELPATKRLLRCSHAAGQANPRDGSDTHHQDGIIDRNGKALSLGERRALARQPSRALLCKLLRDPHPMVAKLLLHNPRITEDDVLRMTSRRPAIVPVMREIAASWAHHGRIRVAIVLNPGSPCAITIPLLTLLTRPELIDVSHAMNVPDIVRATANELLELRPPMADHTTPTFIH